MRKSKELVEDKIFIIKEGETGKRNNNNNRKEKNQLTQTIFFFIFTGESIPPPVPPPPLAVFTPAPPSDKAPYSSFNFFFVIRIISRAEAADARPAISLNFS